MISDIAHRAGRREDVRAVRAALSLAARLVYDRRPMLLPLCRSFALMCVAGACGALVRGMLLSPSALWSACVSIAMVLVLAAYGSYLLVSACATSVLLCIAYARDVTLPQRDAGYTAATRLFRGSGNDVVDAAPMWLCIVCGVGGVIVSTWYARSVLPQIGCAFTSSICFAYGVLALRFVVVQDVSAGVGFLLAHLEIRRQIQAYRLMMIVVVASLFAIFVTEGWLLALFKPMPDSPFIFGALAVVIPIVAMSACMTALFAYACLAEGFSATGSPLEQQKVALPELTRTPVVNIVKRYISAGLIVCFMLVVCVVNARMRYDDAPDRRAAVSRAIGLHTLPTGYSVATATFDDVQKREKTLLLTSVKRPHRFSIVVHALPATVHEAVAYSSIAYRRQPKACTATGVAKIPIHAYHVSLNRYRCSAGAANRFTAYLYAHGQYYEIDASGAPATTDLLALVAVIRELGG